MNFEDIKRLEKNSSVKVTITKAKSTQHKCETNKNLINNWINSEQNKEYTKNPLEYFYEDVISDILKFKFKLALGNTVYSNASDDALACLETCRNFSSLNYYKVHGWLLVALKFVDHFVLHYLQDVRKLIASKIEKTGDEKSRYIHLSKVKCDIAKAGSILITLYNIRNKRLEHRTKTMKDGRTELLKPDRKSIYKEVITYYPEVLKILLSEYKKVFPNLITNS